MADLNNITFACEEPVRLAEFWASALGYEPIESPPALLAEVEKAIDRGELDPTGWAMLVHPEAVGPKLLFQRRPYEEFWTVMKDPEGNGFCVS